MRPGTKLLAFVVALVAVFGTTYAAGSATDPVGLSTADAVEQHGPAHTTADADGLAGSDR